MDGILHKVNPRETEQTFVEKRWADIERIKVIFDPVFPKDMEEWVSTFLGAEDPHKELNGWLDFAELFSEYTAGMSPVAREVVFKGMCHISANEIPVGLE